MKPILPEGRKSKDKTLWAGRSRSLFSFMTFHICCTLKENPDAGITPRRSPASPPGEIERKNRCLS